MYKLIHGTVRVHNPILSEPEALPQDIGVVGKPPTPLDATFFQQQAMKRDFLLRSVTGIPPIHLLCTYQEGLSFD